MAGGSPATSQAGETPSRRKRKAPDSATSASAAAGEDEAEEENEDVVVEKLERVVADLSRRILEHRRDAAARLLGAVASRHAALRPPSHRTILDVPTQSQSDAGTSLPQADEEKLEKLKIFKSKIKANMAAMPRVVKKVNDVVVQTEKLEQLNVNVHPVFRIKR